MSQSSTRETAGFLVVALRLVVGTMAGAEDGAVMLVATLVVEAGAVA